MGITSTCAYDRTEPLPTSYSGVVITFDDITERQTAENDRQMSGAILKRILYTLTEALAVKRANSKCTPVNAAFCEFFSKREIYVVDKIDFYLIPRHSAEKYLNIESAEIQSGRAHNVDDSWGKTTSTPSTHQVHQQMVF